MYHAKITEGQKIALVDSFYALDENCRILFATIAFGMGIIPLTYEGLFTMVLLGTLKDMCRKVVEEAMMGTSVMQCCTLTPDALGGMSMMR